MARTGVKWLPEEDLWCINVFIENYFERLIKTGQSLLSNEKQLEVKRYNQRYGFKRTDDSVKLKFHNIEYLAFKFVAEHGNPYNILILERLKNCSQQQRKIWREQTEKYSDDINKWLNKNIF